MRSLCEHIVSVHHAYLRSELPRLFGLIDKVARAHGAEQPELARLQAVFADLAVELEGHMQKEEIILFPAIRDAEATGAQLPLAAPISVMEHEHDDAARALEQLRELSDGYQAPAGACNTYRAMLDGLAALKSDLHRHIHEENNVLFPRSLALAR